MDQTGRSSPMVASAERNYNFSNRDEATPHPAVLIENLNSKIENGSGWSSAAGHDLFVTKAGL
jgi:hypothetical protein